MKKLLILWYRWRMRRVDQRYKAAIADWKAGRSPHPEVHEWGFRFYQLENKVHELEQQR